MSQVNTCPDNASQLIARTTLNLLSITGLHADMQAVKPLAGVCLIKGAAPSLDRNFMEIYTTGIRELAIYTFDNKLY